jgi:hypothetical protein
MTDELGHQLPNIQYPGLDRRYMVQKVEEFYSRYYFRPRVVLRFLGRAALDSAERRRLFQEAKEFFRVRAQRRAFVTSGKAAEAPPTPEPAKRC